MKKYKLITSDMRMSYSEMYEKCDIFESVEEMFQATGANQYPYENHMWGVQRAYRNNDTYYFRLTEDAQKQAARLFAEGFNERRPTIEKYAEKIYRYNGKLYGILHRMVISNHNKIRGEYICGQEWNGEIRTLRNIL